MIFNIVLLICLIYLVYIMLSTYNINIKKYLYCRHKAKEIIEHMILYEYEFKTNGYMKFKIFNSDIVKIVDKYIQKKKMNYVTNLTVKNDESLYLIIKEKEKQ